MQAAEIVRFNAKLSAPNERGCRLWLAYTDAKGYGIFWLRGSMRRAHRVAYELHVGAIPKGMHVCHSCDVPACVNPEHLWIGTNTANSDDKVAKGRQARVRGTAHGKHKLTEHDVIAIRQSPVGARRLARVYGVDPSTIKYIRSGKLWAHVGENRASS